MFFIFFFLVIFSQANVKAQENELVAYAQPTQIASWLDHAGVYTGTGDKYIFACAGENPDEKQIRYTVSGTGDLKKSNHIGFWRHKCISSWQCIQYFQ